MKKFCKVTLEAKEQNYLKLIFNFRFHDSEERFSRGILD